MKKNRSYGFFVGEIVEALLTTYEVYRATKYLTERYVIKATRRHKMDRRSSREEVVITVGAPNYLERAFIKQARRAGEPFPIKKIQLKFYPSLKLRKAA